MILNGEPLAHHVNYFKYLGSQVAADREWEMDDVHRMNKGYRALGAMKSVLSNSGLWISAQKCIYEGVIVQTVLLLREGK